MFRKIALDIPPFNHTQANLYMKYKVDMIRKKGFD